MAKAPKLANIISLDKFSLWMAEMIQEKSARENAGFIQIRSHSPNDQLTVLVIKTAASEFVVYLEDTRSYPSEMSEGQQQED